MFKKKTTKELVHPGTGADIPAAKKQEKKKKPKKERKPRGAGRNLLKTKTFFGAACIVLALLIAFSAIPMLQAKVSQTAAVLCFAQDVKAGSVVTEGMLKDVEMASYHLPDGTMTDAQDAVGRYVTTDALAGDIVTSVRLSESFPGGDPRLAELPEGKMAMSATLSELAESVSGKLRQGDVIQLFAVLNDKSYTATAPPELQYVEVLAVSDEKGNDLDDTAQKSSSVADESGETESLSTVTLLVNETQAAVLAGLEHNATLHAALVVRGDETAKEKALAAQDTLFTEQNETDSTAASTGGENG